ncbi:hypothetical protein B0T22DRAFT_504748 [Podospora appendiculata]|uniref:Xylanolytic transcriptional activator regulatory domain-containing protein n=1 Tax=Podospora appendiculata TaxID=314037 RepID=A0AAE1CG99_9PEZI|nr:hypothetical protein B0T22DRAFT_504748 [Podospora appendiculata]
MPIASCDGGLPCSTCREATTPCQYDQPLGQPVAVIEARLDDGPSVTALQRENARLEQRLLVLEHKFLSLERDSRLDRLPPHSTQRSVSIEQHADESDVARQHPQSETARSLSNQRDVVDGMGAVALRDGPTKKNISLEPDLLLACPSSNVAFLRFIVRAIGHPATHDVRDHPVKDNPTEQANGSYAFLRRPPCPESLTAESQQRKDPVEPFTLPPPHEAEQLPKLYFTTVNLTIPCIYEDSFRSTWAKARGEGSKNLSQLDREVRRRLWYWCVSNDRWLSVTYGRPPLISISHINPEPTLHLAFSNVPSGITASSQAFFGAITSITHIMGDVLDRIYDQNLGFRPAIPTSEAHNHISQILWRLAQWQDNLPDYLKVISSSDMDASETASVPPTLETTRLRVLLSLRDFGARILVLRLAVIQFFDLSPFNQSNTSSTAASAVPEPNAQSRLLRSSGAVLLADIVGTCGDVLHWHQQEYHHRGAAGEQPEPAGRVVVFVLPQ